MNIQGRTRRVPPELVGEIIGHLRDDQKALKSCSTVSHVWRYTSQRWLFYKVVRDGDDPKTFEAQLAFFETTPHICSYVRVLWLVPAKWGNLMVFRRDLLASLLCKLTRLNELKIWNVAPKDTDGNAVELSGRKLDELCIKNFAPNSTLDGICAVLSLFADFELDHLDYDCPEPYPTFDELPQLSDSPQTLSRVDMLARLRIRKVTFADWTDLAMPLFTALRRSPSLHTMTDFSFRGAAQEIFSTIGDFLRESSVCKLELPVQNIWRVAGQDSSSYTPEFWDPLQLPSCTSLRQIKITPTSHLRDVDTRLTFSWKWPDLLDVSACLPDTVQELDFDFINSGWFDIDLLDWMPARELLSEFPALKRVSFNFEKCVDIQHAPEDFVGYVQQQLPELARQGILVVIPQSAYSRTKNAMMDALLTQWAVGAGLSQL